MRPISEHPKPDVVMQRLSFAETTGNRRSLASRARLAGFQVRLFGSIGHELKRDGDGGRVASFVLYGFRPAQRGLAGFSVTWVGSAAPDARVFFAGWPWRASSFAEVRRLTEYPHEMADESVWVEAPHE